MTRPLRLLTFAVLLAVPASATAQEENPVRTSVQQLYEAGKSNVLRTAEQSPEEDLSFRPTEEVRTLGQILGHLADANFMFCAMALGEENPNTSSIEQADPPKNELIAALTRSYEYCDGAYEQSLEALSSPVDIFGQQATRFHAININVIHNWEHYGNLVTYVRLRGRVPPSSQQQ